MLKESVTIRASELDRQRLEELRRRWAMRSWGEVLRHLISEAAATTLGGEVKGNGEH